MKRVLLLLVALVCFAPGPLRAAQPNGDLDLARRLENAFVNVAARASESVVVITTTSRSTSRVQAPGGEEGEEETPEDFERFFRRFHNFPAPPQRPRQDQGSGVILRPDGFIITNRHVIDNASEIKVRLKDGREFDAKLIGSDPRNDVAVIKIDAKDLPAAVLGDSDALKVGQWAIAIGAPFELAYSFTVGFVSAKERAAMSRTATVYDDYIQTDASINPGNSGGPLCDIEGRVIGLNTLIRGLNTGIGFAIPINTARHIAEQLIAHGKIVRPWIGIAGVSVDEAPQLRGFVPAGTEGVVVTRVTSGTPAAAGGLRPVDIILSIDGIAVRNLKELQVQVLRKKIGQEITLEILRDGKSQKQKLKTAELPEDFVAAVRKPVKAESALGLTVQPLTKDLANQLGIAADRGVVVTSVEQDSAAETAGIEGGDVIVEVNRTPVADVDQFKSAVAAGDLAKGVLLVIQRDGAMTFTVLKQ